MGTMTRVQGRDMHSTPQGQAGMGGVQGGAGAVNGQSGPGTHQGPAPGQGHGQVPGKVEEGYGEEVEEDGMWESVSIPAIASVSLQPNCIGLHAQHRLGKLMRQLQARLPNDAARDTLTRLREAFEVAEAAIPGMTSAFVLEIVENVEQVDEHDV